MELSGTIKVTNLATGLGIALSAVRSQSMRRSDNAKLGHGEQRILLALSKTPVRMGDVCHLATIDKGQLSRTVTELERRGLVTTNGPHRRQQIWLTGRGMALRNGVQRRIAAADAAIMRKLSSAERKALPSILQKLAGI